MVNRILKSIIVGVVVALVSGLVGKLLVQIDADFIQAIGDFMRDFAILIGVPAGVWYYITGDATPLVRK